MTSWYSTADPLGIEVDDEGFAELEKRARTESLSVTRSSSRPTSTCPSSRSACIARATGPASRRGRAPTSIPPPRPGARSRRRSRTGPNSGRWVPTRPQKQGAAIGRHADFPAETRAFFDADATVPAESLGEPELSGGDELAAVVDRAEAVGLEPYVARTTTRDLAALGFEAVRVLVPGAQPLFTGDPFFGDRARDVPRSMGFEPDLEKAYHPFP